MRLKRMFERYPALKPVVEEIIRMKAQGKPYPKIRQYWEKTVKQLYPNDPPSCPSRVSLWRLEEELGKELQDGHQRLEKCPACENYYPSFELQELWLRTPEGQAINLGRLCGDCRYKAQMIAKGFMDSEGHLLRQSGKEQSLEDYIYIGRYRRGSGNARQEED